MSYDTIIVERRGEESELVVLTLNRPQALNAMTTQMGLELQQVFHGLRHDETARCLVLTGAGTRAFSSGADLKERKGMTDAQFLHQHAIFEEAIFEQMGRVPIPVIAAVEGYCFAGGFEMALTADFIIASETAVFALTEVSLGIMPGTGGTQNLPRLAGKPLAKELIFTGRRMAVEEAQRRGLVNHVTPPGSALEETLKIAQVIASNAPFAVRQAKKAIDRGMDMDLDSGLAFSIEAYNQLVHSEDRQEGINAFNEKRRPRFKGR